jgi:hypothetical protein
MFYEDVVVRAGETVSGLAVAYGYKITEWQEIWDDPRNLDVVSARERPERLRVGDTLQVPISWGIVRKRLTRQADGGLMEAWRDGELGRRLSWVQTVNRDNQPAGPNPNRFCVDACTPDDDLPFYYTNAEIAAQPNRRKYFRDHSSRPAPTAAQGTTHWRAIVSIAVVTEQRVTVWDSQVWGWDMTPANVITTVGPRRATPQEVRGHLNLLRNGLGTGVGTFGANGWTFREAPIEIGDFPGPGDFPSPSPNVRWA